MFKCIGACWAASHQKFRDQKTEDIDLSLLPRGKSVCIEAFIKGIFDTAKLDRWTNEKRTTLLNSLVTKGMFSQETLEMTTQFMPK